MMGDDDMDAIRMLGDMLRETNIGGVGGKHFGNATGASSSDEGGAEIDEEHTSFMMDEDIPPTDGGEKGPQYVLQGNSTHSSSTPLESSETSSPSAAVDGTGGGGAANHPPGFTPLKPDRLIPVDLLGVLDDPSTPAPSQSASYPAATLADPTAAAADRHPSVAGGGGKRGKGKKKKGAGAQDLAAALFRPSRARSNSMSGEKSPMLKPVSMGAASAAAAVTSPMHKPLSAAMPSPEVMSASPRTSAMGSAFRLRSGAGMRMVSPQGLNGMGPSSAMVANGIVGTVPPDLFQKQLDSATQILLSMNATIGEEAAMEAALVSDNDVNVAQYVIDGAMSAPPICRHMLHDGCYRSDCQFSHDVEGHTCLFWLRGRCGKGDGCRFMHGYSSKLLEGIKADFLPGRQREKPQAQAMGNGIGGPIRTANLVQHNMNVPFAPPPLHGGTAPFSFLGSPHMAAAAAPSVTFDESSFGQSGPGQHGPSYYGAPTPSSTPAQPSVLEAAMAHQRKEVLPPATPAPAGDFPKINEPSNTPAPGSGSGAASPWARVAQRGYSQRTSFSGAKESRGGTQEAPQVGKGTNGKGGGSGGNNVGNNGGGRSKSVKIPQDLWNPSERRDSSVFHITDPMQRYREVSSTHPRKDVVDLHFQSVRTFPVVLSRVMQDKLRECGEVWVVTGSGHHVSRGSHQKGGGVLEGSVLAWLDEHGYDYLRGKDRNGFCGAVLVKSKR